MMTFEKWLGERVLDDELLATRRRVWSYLLTKGLTGDDIAIVFDKLC